MLKQLELVLIKEKVNINVQSDALSFYQSKKPNLQESKAFSLKRTLKAITVQLPVLCVIFM